LRGQQPGVNSVEERESNPTLAADFTAWPVVARV